MSTATQPVPAKSPLMLSVSGCRGIVGGSMTPAFVTRYVSAFAAWIRERDVPACAVVARDGRAGGEVIHALAVATLRASGLEVIDLDVATTPTAGLIVTERKAGGGLVVTASHNPGEWNGLKPLDERGAAPQPEVAADILRRYADAETALAGADSIGDLVADDSAAHVHAAAVLAALGELIDVEKIRRRAFSVALDSVNASGARAGRLLLDGLGCRVTHINSSDSGVFPHTPEPTEENLGGLRDVVRRESLELGFAQDPDADRLAIVGRDGVYPGEEYTLVLASLAMLETSKNPESVRIATNLSTSRMIDDVASAAGATVIRAPVGEANVVAAMREHDCVLGGEGNGGVIWPRIVSIRDSLAAMGLVLALLSLRDESVEEIIDTVPRYHIAKRKQPLEGLDARRAIDKLAAHFSDARHDTQDGLRMDFDDRRAWLHVRPSNTEPILRLIAEAPSDASAAALLDTAEALIGGAGGS